MQHLMPTDEVLEVAALYALGALGPEEAAAFEGHLGEGCRACEEEVKAFAAIIEHLGYAAPPQSPRPEVLDRLIARVRSDAAGAPTAEKRSEAGAEPTHPDSTIIRSTEGEWQAGHIEGLLVKRLFLDPDGQRFTALARLKAGVHYPSHRHADTEELYLLEGDLTVEDQALRAGDFCAATAGSVHRSTYTRGGCAFFVIASERDEIAETGAVGDPETGLVFVRATDGAWQKSPVEGVAIKPIFSDPVRGTITSLVRMRPGARLSVHRHLATQQLYMLEGAASIAGHVLKAGDYYRGAARTLQAFESAGEGCSFLRVCSREEMLVGVAF